MKCIPVALSQVQPAHTDSEILLRVILAIPQVLENKEYFLCGGCRINTLIYDRKTKSKPKVSSLCRCEIDWVGIKSKLVKECPRCHRIYASRFQVCEDHLPAVDLLQKEVPISSNTGFSLMF